MIMYSKQTTNMLNSTKRTSPIQKDVSLARCGTADIGIKHNNYVKTFFVHAGDSLKSKELNDIVSGVIQESDIAKTHKLTYTEFEHVVSRAPDFVNLFHVTI